MDVLNIDREVEINCLESIIWSCDENWWKENINNLILELCVDCRFKVLKFLQKDLSHLEFNFSVLAPTKSLFLKEMTAQEKLGDLFHDYFTTNSKDSKNSISQNIYVGVSVVFGIVIIRITTFNLWLSSKKLKNEEWERLKVKKLEHLNWEKEVKHFYVFHLQYLGY